MKLVTFRGYTINTRSTVYHLTTLPAFFRKAARSRRLRLGGRGRGRAGGIQLYRMADGRRADADGWEGALIFLAPSRDYRSLQSYLRLHEFGDTVQ